MNNTTLSQLGEVNPILVPRVGTKIFNRHRGYKCSSFMADDILDACAFGNQFYEEAAYVVFPVDIEPTYDALPSFVAQTACQLCCDWVFFACIRSYA